MAKTSVDQWDAVPANNTEINSIPLDGAVTTPSQVDDIFREMMAQIKTFSTSAFTSISTDAGAVAGPILTLYRNSATPAVNDVIGQINFDGEDSAGNQTTYARITPTIADPTNGSEDANLFLVTQVAGSETAAVTITPSGVNIPVAFSISTGAVTSGTYAPAFTNVANLISMTAPEAWSYVRVGDRVNVFGLVVLDFDAGAGTASDFRFTLPVATTFATTSDMGGSGGNFTANSAPLFVNALSSTGSGFARTYAPNTSANTYSIHFTYKVI